MSSSKETATTPDTDITHIDGHTSAELYDLKGQLQAINRSQAIIEFKLDGTILTANSNFLQTMGFSLEEVKGKHHSLFVDQSYRQSQEYKTFWEDLNRGEFKSGEYKRLGKGGKQIWLQATYNPILDKNGAIIKIVKFASDVTQQKLENQEAMGLYTAVQNAQAVIEFDLDGTIITANHNFLTAMGYSLDEVKGRHHGMFVESAYRESEEYQRFWESLRQGNLNAALFKRLNKEGHPVYIQASYNPVFDDEGRLVKIIKFATDVTEQQNAQEQVSELVELAIKGQLERRIDTEHYSGTIGKFVGSVNGLMDAVVGPVKEASKAMQSLAEGDLTQRMEGDFDGEFATLRDAVNTSLGDLGKIVGTIRDSAQDIVSASRDISQGNTDLSRRTEQQAASLEETAASMEELSSTMKQNADNATLADKLSSTARDKAKNGGTVVAKAISAMDEINHASKKIADIIGVIDEIAFQTNLLALNAAVEAARAGEQGRGFAVVAQEVRNLAQRSASAAKEIKVLITDSVEKVDEGSVLVNQSGEVLDEIVESIVQVNEVIGEITLASQEQSSGIDQVNDAVTGMDSTTQQNAALVEQAAAASQSMSDQAFDMQRLIEHFVTQDNSEKPEAANSSPMTSDSDVSQRLRAV